MRLLATLALAATALAAFPADAMQRDQHRRGARDGGQEAAFHAAQRGRILPLGAILSRVRIPGAQFIGAEFDPSGAFYRLKYIRGSEVIWIDVDARTGRMIGRR
jgi:hypothetical protein